MKKRAINTILIAMLFFTLIPVRADAYVLNSYPFPSSMKDEIMYSNLDVQSCMVVLVVIAALLLSVISVVAAQAPVI